MSNDLDTAKWDRRIAIGAGISNIIMALVAIVGIPLLYRQLSLTQESNRTTREQVYKGERAYLVVRRAELGEPLTVGKPLLASVQITNSGQTPAANVTYAMYLRVLPGVPDGTDYRDEVPAGSLGAGQTVKVFGNRLNVLTAAEHADITEHEIALVGNEMTISYRPKLLLYGLVRYTDVFGERGETEFCAAYNQRARGFAACVTHNDMK